jgi:hypothetical protein
VVLDDLANDGAGLGFRRHQSVHANPKIVGNFEVLLGLVRGGHKILVEDQHSHDHNSIATCGILNSFASTGIVADQCRYEVGKFLLATGMLLLGAHTNDELRFSAVRGTDSVPAHRGVESDVVGLNARSAVCARAGRRRRGNVELVLLWATE